MKSDSKTPLIKINCVSESHLPSGKHSAPVLPSTPPGHAESLCFLLPPVYLGMLHTPPQNTLHLPGKLCLSRDQLWAFPQVLQIFLKAPPAPNLFICWYYLVTISHRIFSSHLAFILCSLLPLLLHIFLLLSDRLSSIPLSKHTHFSKSSLMSVFFLHYYFPVLRRET